MNQSPMKVCAAPPKEFEPKKIEDFTAFVLAGGEVTSGGLKERVMNAQCLSFLRSGDCLLGVAGLKSPEPTYRDRVAQNSKTQLALAEYPYELGWVFILPSARGGKQSLPLCQPLLTAAKGAGVFATSRTTLSEMHRTLEKLGFVRSGSEWPSKENNGSLALFLRHSV